MTDSLALREEIKNCGFKYKHVALKLGITPYGLQKKIENNTEFKASEISILSDLLGLSTKKREAIFFSKNGD